MKKWIFIVGGLTIAVVVLLLLRGNSQGKSGIDASLVVAVKRGDLETAVAETGKIEPRARTEVKSKVAGQVIQVFVREGERITIGQKLIQLDPIDYRREVDRVQAEALQNRLQLEYANAQLGRRAKALEGRGISEAEYETAKREADLAKARVELTKVALAGAQDRLRYTTIVSPMDGVVIERGIEAGEVVTPGVTQTFQGKPLLVVADLAELKVIVRLNQIDVAKVRSGAEADVVVDALPGRKFKARIAKVAPAAVADTFPVEAVLEGDTSGIKPGMTADVMIRVGSKAGALMLPIEAVVSQRAKQFGREVGAEKHSVLLVEESGGTRSTKRIDVEVGERNDRDVEIRKGLSEGQKVLIQPGSAEQNEAKM